MQRRRLLRRAGHVYDPPGQAVELPGSYPGAQLEGMPLMMKSSAARR